MKFDEAIEKILENKMSVQEIADKYTKNPAGIGADSIEDGKDYITLYFSSSYDRDQTIEKLKSLGIKNSKMKNMMGKPGESYRYQLVLFKK